MLRLGEALRGRGMIEQGEDVFFLTHAELGGILETRPADADDRRTTVTSRRREAAVVTDGRSLAAHASLVAREYGIPAEVGAGDATARLHDGQMVTVDGSAGVVELHRV